ncbi:hypothetical protein D915_001214 [Fasciola hepatica]|uniref:Uncharacterized protein n=1 Tax=Fasciola hepatica TaxID=6192 RepID=A0A4E0RZ62_FASHE|nr:hypothetical protein D915_001214 [Fasciola hepatica]
MRRTLFSLSILAMLLIQCAYAEPISIRMFNPEGEVLRREYVTSSRVDRALERCLQFIGIELGQGDLDASVQLDRLRKCMMTEFAGKRSPQHWNILQSMA